MPMSLTSPPRITSAGIRRARARFREGAAGDLFYRAAIQLIADARQGASDLDLAESIGVLLQTWNTQFYRFRGGYKEQDTAAIRRLLAKHNAALDGVRDRRLDQLSADDERLVLQVFHDFEIALGQVGAAKALHLLAPRFFPLWDQRIAQFGYGIRFKAVGQNSSNYLLLMRATLEQINQLGGWHNVNGNPVKAIDEYNYCLHTRAWTTK
jgi:hypothetical protein